MSQFRHIQDMDIPIKKSYPLNSNRTERQKNNTTLTFCGVSHETLIPAGAQNRAFGVLLYRLGGFRILVHDNTKAIERDKKQAGSLKNLCTV